MSACGRGAHPQAAAYGDGGRPAWANRTCRHRRAGERIVTDGPVVRWVPPRLGRRHWKESPARGTSEARQRNSTDAPSRFAVTIGRGTVPAAADPGALLR